VSFELHDDGNIIFFQLSLNPLKTFGTAVATQGFYSWLLLLVLQ
jgi:hypothetical protein